MEQSKEAKQVISELYDEFSKEAIKLQVKYDNNVSKLDELDLQIRSMSKTEDVDLKVFSPRRRISSETEKSAKLKETKEDLIQSNLEVERMLRYYSKRADRMKMLLELLTSNESIFKDEKEQPTALTKEELVKLQHRLDNCYHFIDTDPMRAKMEMKELLLFLGEFIVESD